MVHKFYSFLTLCTLATTPLLLGQDKDLLRLKNGDTSHGNYLALEEGPILRWKAKEALEPTSYRTENLRKIVLNAGSSAKLVTSEGHLITVAGDNFPGSLISMGSDSVSLETPYAGLLTFPRDQVASLYPNRAKGKVYYAGPFSEESWSMIETKQEIEDREADDTEPAAEEQLWKFGNGAWYSNSEQPLCLQVPLPDRVSIRFQLAWQNKLHVSLALMADFQVPVAKEQADDAPDEEAPDDDAPAEDQFTFVPLKDHGTGRTPAENFGSGFSVDLHNSYGRMQKLTFGEDGQSRSQSFSTASGRSQLTNIYSATIELRCDRLAGKVSLFINGDFYAEWQDEGEPLSDVDRFFAIRALQKANLQVTDLVVSEWNGMPDAARSMENEERDVLLLANGTDRISGQILSLEEDMFQVKTRFGDFRIPAAEVTEIHLATGSRAEPPSFGDNDIFISLQPRGRVTLTPEIGQGKTLKGTHPVLGDLTIDLDYSYLLEFDPQRTIFDNWDNDF